MKIKVTYRQVKKALARGWKSPLNNRDGAFKLPSWKVVKPAVEAITGAQISNAAHKAMKQSNHVVLFKRDEILITLRDNKNTGLKLSLFNSDESMLTEYFDVVSIDDVKHHINKFAKRIKF